MAQRPRTGPRVPFVHSLQTKFMLSYGAIILALVIFLNTYPILISQNMVFQSKRDALWRQADIITSALAGREALTAEGVAATLSMLGVTGVDRLMVTRPDGLVLYDTSEVDNAQGKYALLWEVVTALGGDDVFQSEYRDGAFRSRSAAPIRYRGMTQGAVYLYEYDQEQAQLLLDLQTNLLRISVVVCVAALLFSVVLSKAITRRVAVLLQGIRSVREGEYSYRVTLSGSDELSRLADEFNELTGRLQTTEEVRRRFVRRLPRAQDPPGLHSPAHRFHPPERRYGPGDGAGFCLRYRQRGRTPDPHHRKAPHPHPYGHRAPPGAHPCGPAAGDPPRRAYAHSPGTAGPHHLPAGPLRRVPGILHRG